MAKAFSHRRWRNAANGNPYAPLPVAPQPIARQYTSIFARAMPPIIAPLAGAHVEEVKLGSSQKELSDV